MSADFASKPRPPKQTGADHFGLARPSKVVPRTVKAALGR